MTILLWEIIILFNYQFCMRLVFIVCVGSLLLIYFVKLILLTPCSAELAIASVIKLPPFPRHNTSADLSESHAAIHHGCDSMAKADALHSTTGISELPSEPWTGRSKANTVVAVNLKGVILWRWRKSILELSHRSERRVVGCCVVRTTIYSCSQTTWWYSV